MEENTRKQNDVCSLLTMICAILTIVFAVTTRSSGLCKITFWLTDMLYLFALVRKENDKGKKYRSVAIVIAFFLATANIWSLGNSVSQEEYDEIAASKEQWENNYNNLREKYIALSESSNSEETTQASIVEQADTVVAETQVGVVPSVSYVEMHAGTFIVGEDILNGKYDFYVSKGNGELKIYNSYDDFKNDEYGFDAFLSYDILAEGASRGLLNEDVCTNCIRNIKLTGGQVVVIEDGATVLCYNSVDCTYDDNVLNTGVYVVGTDIAAGKYSFQATDGMGEFKVYTNNDVFMADEYGFDAFIDYNMRAEGASVGLTNEDIYTEYADNINLEDENVVIITDGLTITITN